MKLKHSKQEFEKFVNLSNALIPELTLTDAVRLMLDFYRDVHVDDIPIESDTLSYQWGHKLFRQEAFFVVAVTRHFSEVGSFRDEGLTRLSLICCFQPSLALTALKTGHRLCHSSAELVEFKFYINASSPFLAVATLKPDKVSVEYQ